MSQKQFGTVYATVGSAPASSSFVTEDHPDERYTQLVSSASSVSTAVPTPVSISGNHQQPLTSPTKKLKIAPEQSAILSSQEDDKVKFIVANALAALSDCGGMASLRHYLGARVDMLLRGGPYKTGSTGGVDDVIVTNWIEELIRFLAIKTVAGDTVVPSEMLPSGPIDGAWKALMIMPTMYVKVCQSMGNEHVIDRDPYIDDRDQTDIDAKSRKKCFNSTRRAYYHCFEQDPPRLYWPDPTLKTSHRSIFNSSATSVLQQMVDTVNSSKNTLLSSGTLKRMFEDCK